MSTKTCPSGMVIDVRELTGRDGRYLANPKHIRDNEVEDFILSNTTSLVEPGPAYSFTGKTDWAKALVGDRSFAFLAIREETFPSAEEPFVFRVACANTVCKASERPFEWSVDIARFLAKKTKQLSTEDAATFRNGNRFESKVPFTEKRFWFRLRTGADQKRLATMIEQRASQSKKKQAEANRMLDSLAESVVEVEGIPPGRANIVEYLESLSMRSIDALLPLIQAHDCGVETTIFVQCPRCGTKRAVELPFDRTFLLPKSSKLSKQEDTDPDEDDPAIEGMAIGTEAAEGEG